MKEEKEVVEENWRKASYCHPVRKRSAGQYPHLSSECIMDQRSPVGFGDSLGSCLINTVMLAEARRGPARGSKLLAAVLTITRLLFPLGSMLASLREDMILQSLQDPILQKPVTRRGQCVGLLCRTGLNTYVCASNSTVPKCQQRD